MPPDLNTMPSRAPSLPSSPLSHSSRPRRISFNQADYFRPNLNPPSPRSPPLSSLQAAATINSSLHRSPSNASPARQGLERRRSSLMNNFSINDPSVPAPGEMQQGGGSNSSSPRLGRRSITYATADPHHHRQPSLGEIHQELENEQEAQVNRLLFMIRLQQEQLASVQRHPSEPSPSSTEQSRFPTPPSALHTPSTTMTEHSSPLSGSISGFPHPQGHFNRPHSLSRQSSTARVPSVGTNSRGTSPALHPVSGSLGPLTEDFLLGGTRDECAFYQAETQTLTRENQMLKLRIRELERQISEMSITSQSTANSAAALTHSPHQNSPLASPPTTASGEAESATTTPNEPTPA